MLNESGERKLGDADVLLVCIGEGFRYTHKVDGVVRYAASIGLPVVLACEQGYEGNIGAFDGHPVETVIYDPNDPVSKARVTRVISNFRRE